MRSIRGRYQLLLLIDDVILCGVWHHNRPGYDIIIDSPPLTPRSRLLNDTKTKSIFLSFLEQLLCTSRAQVQHFVAQSEPIARLVIRRLGKISSSFQSDRRSANIDYMSPYYVAWVEGGFVDVLSALDARGTERKTIQDFSFLTPSVVRFHRAPTKPPATPILLDEATSHNKQPLKWRVTYANCLLQALHDRHGVGKLCVKPLCFHV